MNTASWLYLIFGVIGAFVYLLLRLSGKDDAQADLISEKVLWAVLVCVVIAFLSLIFLRRLN